MMRRVLVVDPEPHTATALREFIARMVPDAQVLSARSGEEARVVIRQNRIDVLVIDRDLPDISGPDFIRELRHTGPAPETILLARDPTPELAEEVVNELKVAGFFRRPFDTARIEAKVADLLRKRPGSYGRIPPTRPGA